MIDRRNSNHGPPHGLSVRVREKKGRKAHDLIIVSLGDGGYGFVKGTKEREYMLV